MALRGRWCVAFAALLPLSRAVRISGSRAPSLPVEEINLDLPPEERWHDIAVKYKKDIVEKAKHMGALYQKALGEHIAARWFKAAPVPDELMTEYKSIVRYVNNSEVTLERLVITDMWQAVDAPTFGCTGLLAAMENGTVIHGRNVDYDIATMASQVMKYHTGLGIVRMFDGVFTRGGRPVASFISQGPGSLGIHTGMRLGAYSINSNARVSNNKMNDNLEAMEHGGKNFPWVMRLTLQNVADFESAVKVFETTELNAPNYFILAGSKPYQGVVITRDRKGTHEHSTPSTQRLNKTAGIWHLVQTNDDLLSPALDRRRDAALRRLSDSSRSKVDVNFVWNEMHTSPVKNPDTLLTWVANPQAGTHIVQQKDAVEFVQAVLQKVFKLPDPRDLPKPERNISAKTVKSKPRGNATLGRAKPKQDTALSK